jgi:hypothetical protein
MCRRICQVAIDLDKLFDDFAERVQTKFEYYYPSRGNNPPTEANITSTLTELMYAAGYFCFAEIPLDLGQVDFLAVRIQEHRVAELCVAEVKEYMHEDAILRDFERLRRLRAESTTEFLKLSPGTAPIVAFCVAWSENKARADKLTSRLSPSAASGDRFAGVVTACPHYGIRPLRFGRRQEPELWTLYFGESLPTA